jgi:hypothetical protein
VLFRSDAANIKFRKNNLVAQIKTLERVLLSINEGGLSN